MMDSYSDLGRAVLTVALTGEIDDFQNLSVNEVKLYLFKLSSYNVIRQPILSILHERSKSS